LVALIALAGACGAAGAAWSAAAGKASGEVVGGIAVLLAVGGWWGGRPWGLGLLCVERGRALTDRARGPGMPDMAGHGVALRGADAVGDAVLREQLTELEEAQVGGWTWDPATLPQQILTPGSSRGALGGGIIGDGIGGGHH
jgi:hypothetical protein